MSGNGFLRLLFRPEIRRHGDVGKKPPFVTRVASRAHPLAGCRGAATEAARSAGKGRFGGNVETRISPAVTSPGNTTAWGRRKKSLPLSPVSPAERTRLRGAEAPQRKPRAAPAKGGLEGMSKRGFLRLLLRPEIQLHGDAEKKASLCHPCRQPSAPACGVPRRRNGSRAQRRQREVWRECRNEDFSGCYFARKYNCMGTPEKSHCSRILFSKKRR